MSVLWNPLFRLQKNTFYVSFPRKVLENSQYNRKVLRWIQQWTWYKFLGALDLGDRATLWNAANLNECTSWTASFRTGRVKPAETDKKKIKTSITLRDSRDLGKVARTEGSSVLQTYVKVCCETQPCKTLGMWWSFIPSLSWKVSLNTILSLSCYGLGSNVGCDGWFLCSVGNGTS